MLKILSVVSMFCLLGCRTLEEAPITHFRVIDVQHMKCSIRPITDKQTMASVHKETVDLINCDGVWGLTAKEFLDLRTYLKKEAQEEIKAQMQLQSLQ